MSRPCELTDAIADAICADIERGIPIGLAAGPLGFTRQAVDKWQRQGRAEMDAGETEGVRARFVVKLAGARARLARSLIERVHVGATGKPFEADWRAAIAALETLMPTHFGKRALEAQAALEDATDAAPSDGPGDGQVRVELVRCPSCGADQLPDKKFCGDCGKAMAPAGGIDAP